MDFGTFKISATEYSIKVTCTVPTEEEAQVLVRQFSKAAKVRATQFLAGHGRVYGYVMFDARLMADGVNGGRNETGIRRYRSVRKTLAILDAKVEWTMNYTNSLTEEVVQVLLGEG